MSRSIMLLLALVLTALGCDKRSRYTEPEKPDIEGGLRKNIPVLDRTMIQSDLRSIHQFYFATQTDRNRPPAKLEELELDKEALKLHRKVKDGLYVIVFGTDCLNPRGGRAQTVLAYEKDALENKGWVVMANGEPQMMANSELKKALQDQKK